ncbi:hypothetical protein BDW74DRAFT_169912 [Aspergillus multicolor]|uniref:uncharacterized protein n=1 Tax=Aspergillus multicolor TaxID=41759 RepID=UPI003CCE1226
MALATAHFERDFGRTHAHTIQVLEAERGRTHRMERLLLRIEIENLQMLVNQRGLELIQARETEANTRLDLEEAVRELDRLKNLTQASSREIDNLRHELASLNTIASDTQKLKAEKVHLTKEVSSIRSEVEELRSQNASANALLTEKQEMSLQLNALELQLENEKRALERALTKESQQIDEVAALTIRLNEARRELELARGYIQEGIQQKGSALANSSPSSRGRKGINQNLRTLKDCHLEDTPVQQQEGWSTTITKKVPIADGPHPQKVTSRLHSDLIIATPGAVRAQPQQKPLTTLPGDKSSFSITPFLNRTTGLGETTTSSEDELNEDSNAANDGHGTNSTAFLRQLMPPAAKNTNNPAKRIPLKTAVDGDTRARQKQKVLESPEGDGSYQTSLSHPVGQKQFLSKKRKLGLQRDRSLFDEEEDEITLQDTRNPGRKLVGAGQPSATGNRAFTGPIGFSSSKRWQARQLKDHFTREAAVQGLKSRAAFKLLQGYAPGSWSQVALARTQPKGRVLGVDIIPSQPPRGVSTIQGNFLDPAVQAYAREFVRNPQRGRPYSPGVAQETEDHGRTVESILEASRTCDALGGGYDGYLNDQRTVDVVLSDMSAPWHQTTGFWKRSLSNPYHRMMNTSGVTFKDHAGSMDLCRAALGFSYEVLKTGGHFVCKFYQGAEDKDLEKQLKALFQKVHRLKPDSSRSESKEAYFIGLDRKAQARKQDVLTGPSCET